MRKFNEWLLLKEFDNQNNDIHQILYDLYGLHNYISNPGTIFNYNKLGSKIHDLERVMGDNVSKHAIGELMQYYEWIIEILSKFPKQRQASREDYQQFQANIRPAWQAYKDCLDSISKPNIRHHTSATLSQPRPLL